MAKTTTERSPKRILNVLPSPDQHKDWRYEDAAAAGIVAGPTGVVPPAKDLRQGNAWWKIRDQGNTGSCVGFATADSVLRWHFVEAGKLGKSQAPSDFLSPRFTWMAAKETDPYTEYPTTMIEEEGTWLKAALDVSRKYGAATEEDLPFEPERLWNKTRPSFYALTARYKIASYYNLSPSTAMTPEALFLRWREWIAKHGPILTRLDVDATWMNVASDGLLDKYQLGTGRGGHAVAIVGYNKDRFIVRNSWGLNWGDKGYAYASFGYAQAAFSEAYGVTV